MLITASEYSSMGFPAVSGGDVESCIKRSDYIISALTEGRAEKSVEAGGKPAELVKQAAFSDLHSAEGKRTLREKLTLRFGEGLYR